MIEGKQCIFIFFIVLYLSIGLVTTYEGCKIVHGRRGCISKSLQGVIVTCDGQGSHKIIPRDIPANTVYLSLKNFRFKGIIKKNFTHLTKVECFIIKDSGITAIEFDAFTDMEKLHELQLRKTLLSGNDLQFLNNPQFTAIYVTVSDSKNILSLDFNGTKYLNKIESLKFAGNSISHINPSIVSNLRSVRKLDLSNNQLESLDWSLLSGLRKLNRLYLESNEFQTLPESAESTFAAVKELKLGNNPLHCNCALQWLKEYYETAVDRILDYDTVECTSPFKEPVHMMNTSPEQFTCSRPEKPAVIWEKLSDTKYEVHCSGFGDPPPDVTLILPGMNPFIYQAPTDLSQLNVTNPPVVLTSTGTVVCKAENSQGVDVSKVNISSSEQGLYVVKCSFTTVLYMKNRDKMEIFSEDKDHGGNHGHKSSISTALLLVTLWKVVFHL